MHVHMFKGADRQTDTYTVSVSDMLILLIGTRHRCVFFFFFYKIAAEKFKCLTNKGLWILGKIIYRYEMKGEFCSKYLRWEGGRDSFPTSQIQNNDVICMTNSAWTIRSWYLRTGRPFCFHAASSKSLFSTIVQATHKTGNWNCHLLCKPPPVNPQGNTVFSFISTNDIKKALTKPNCSWENRIWKPQG